MKKVFFGLSLIFVIFLFSCSNPQNSVLTSQDNTLRSSVQEKISKTVWTNELEPDRLKSKLNTQIGNQRIEYITPQMLNSIKDLQPAVYPEIKGFASLDCSAMNKTLLQFVAGLCDSLCKGTDNLADYFEPNYFYNCVFFINDIKEALGEETESEALFDRYLICQGFEGDLIQVPVRFYKGKETLDLSVYLTYHGEYKVIQIEILGWGKTYGESKKSE